MRVNRLPLVLVATSIVLPVVAFPACGQDTNVPRIEFPEVVDFGRISNSESTWKEVVIDNKGKKELQIEGVLFSCCATEAELKEKTIPPGGKGRLVLRVNPQRVPGFSSRETGTIYCNDPLNPLYQFKVIAQVDPEFIVEPGELIFGDLQKGAKREGDISVRQAGDEVIELTGIKQGRRIPGLKMEYRKRPANEWQKPDKPEYTIHYALDTADVPPRLYNEFRSLFIGSTCKRLPWLPCYVSFRVVSFYEVSSDSIRWDGTSAERGKKVSTLELKSNESIEVNDIQVDNADFLVTAREGTAPNTIVLEVTVRPDAKEGEKKGFLEFNVKNGKESVRDRVYLAGRVWKGPA